MKTVNRRIERIRRRDGSEVRVIIDDCDLLADAALDEPLGRQDSGSYHADGEYVAMADRPQKTAVRKPRKPDYAATPTATTPTGKWNHRDAWGSRSGRVRNADYIGA